MKRFLIVLALFMLTSLGCIAQGRRAWDTIPKGFDKKVIAFIVEESLKNDIDPELIFALINEESEWKLLPPSKNRNGTYDYGLMRLNGAYIDEYIWRYGDKGRKYYPKTNIYDNIELGIRHFAVLYRECNGNALLALYSYNCGLTRTLEGRIPESTKNYAMAILTIYDPSFFIGTD